MFNGKMKAVTFSYDDGVTQDKRLIELFDKYHLKATFNLNSETLGQSGICTWIPENPHVTHIKCQADEVKAIYRHHEVASHTLTHPNLTTLDKEEIIRQVEQDRLNLESLTGKPVTGMAYPCGDNNDIVAEVIRQYTGIQYARTVTSSGNFEPQSNLWRFNPSVYHMDKETMWRLGKEFVELKPVSPKLFYIWGHSYEFDILDTWNDFEEFCKLIANREDSFYGTNSEVLLGK